MYNLPQYKEKDQKVVLDFIHQHPFAFLTACSEENKPVATQVPVFIEEREGKLYLSGHIMRNTDHHVAMEKNPNVLCVFTGPHTYVSGTWYKDPHIASTWNYISVHVKGKVSFLGLDALKDVLRKTSLHFENSNAHSSTVFDNLPEEYTVRLVKAIVAFEIEVEEIDDVFKLSQNRDEESYHNIIGKLEASGHDGKFIADEMKKRASQLFNKNKDQ
ncbi:MAG TPA: FMN-binding negative transcriptional regulator [Chitinophagaceae bacterium]|nr:FMN-binding negative transcriptional regulator [Chitinophagaceae bacterium]